MESLPIQYRETVMVAVTRRASDPLDPEVLLINQNYADEPEDVWRLPQGGVDTGESLAQAGLREVEEEVGLSLGCRPHHITVPRFGSMVGERVRDGLPKRYWNVAVHLGSCASCEIRPNPSEHVRKATFFPLSVAHEAVAAIPSEGGRSRNQQVLEAVAQHSLLFDRRTPKLLELIDRQLM